MGRAVTRAAYSLLAAIEAERAGKIGYLALRNKCDVIRVFFRSLILGEAAQLIVGERRVHSFADLERE